MLSKNVLIISDIFSLQEALKVFLEAIDRRPEHYAPQSLYNMLGKLNTTKEMVVWPDSYHAYRQVEKFGDAIYGGRLDEQSSSP